MDQELFKAGIEMVQAKLPEPGALPESSVREIAKEMVKFKRLGNAEWLLTTLRDELIRVKALRSLAKSQGFAPFINMGAKAYRYIEEQYAPWILPMMEERLLYPEDITGPWAVQFADAMDAIGQTACENATRLFDFITATNEWKDAIPVKEAFLKTVKPKKNKSSKPKSEATPAPKAKTKVKEGAPISGKAELLIKIHEVPDAGVKSNQHRFFTVESGEKQFKITIKPRMFKKIEEAAESFDNWVGIISGDIGNVQSNKVMVVENATVQVYEKKHKPSAAELIL